jgi:hypothetical protein
LESLKKNDKCIKLVWGSQLVFEMTHRAGRMAQSVYRNHSKKPGLLRYPRNDILWEIARPFGFGMRLPFGGQGVRLPAERECTILDREKPKSIVFAPEKSPLLSSMGDFEQT